MCCQASHITILGFFLFLFKHGNMTSINVLFIEQVSDRSGVFFFEHQKQYSAASIAYQVHRCLKLQNKQFPLKASNWDIKPRTSNSTTWTPALHQRCLYLKKSSKWMMVLLLLSKQTEERGCFEMWWTCSIFFFGRKPHSLNTFCLSMWSDVCSGNDVALIESRVCVCVCAGASTHVPNTH